MEFQELIIPLAIWYWSWTCMWKWWNCKCWSGAQVLITIYMFITSAFVYLCDIKSKLNFILQVQKTFTRFGPILFSSQGSGSGQK